MPIVNIESTMKSTMAGNRDCCRGIEHGERFTEGYPGEEMKNAGEKEESMTPSNTPFVFPDNGGERSGIERRQFSYTSHIPERRTGKDRRSSNDRRKILDPDISRIRVGGIERRAACLRYLRLSPGTKRSQT
jgi:hypothetical protein